MSSLPYEQWSHASKNMLEPLLEFNGITTRIYGEIARENLKTMNDLMQANAEQLQGLSHIFSHPRGLEALMDIQARSAANITPKLCQHAQQVLDTMMEGTSEYSKWFEKGFEQYSKEGKNIQEHFIKESKHFQEKTMGGKETQPHRDKR